VSGEVQGAAGVGAREGARRPLSLPSTATLRAPHLPERRTALSGKAAIASARPPPRAGFRRAAGLARAVQKVPRAVLTHRRTET
jgi:hypothetical protein